MLSDIFGYLTSYLADISPLTLGLTVFLCGLFYQLCFRERSYSNPLPPSAGLRLPVIGHMYRLKPDMRGPLKELRARYGDVYKMYFGSRLVIIVSGYRNLKDMFVKEGDTYVDRPYMPLMHRLTRGKGITMGSLESWKQHRRFALSTLKDLGMGRSTLDTKLMEEAGRITAAFEKEAMTGRGFDPRLAIATSVANIVCSMVFGQSFQNGDPKFQAITEMFEENLRLGAGAVNFFPSLMKLPGDLFSAKKMIQNSDHIFEFCNDVIKGHIEGGKNVDKDDFVEAYLSEMKRQEVEKGESVFSLEHLASTFTELFMAGTETTTSSLRWAILCLIVYPEQQQRMFTEIAEQIGTDRPPSVLDRLKLPFVEAFISEAMRYCELGILGLVHSATHDTVFRGFTIPKTAIILPDFSSVLHDVTIWGDPGTFRPERYLDENGKLLKREEDISFFLGKRGCPGESLARMEMVIFLSSIVQRFKLEPPGGQPMSMETVGATFGVTHAPKDFQILAVPRD